MKQLNLSLGIRRDEKDDLLKSGSLNDILGDTLLRDDNLFIIGSEAVLKKETPGTNGSGDSVLFLFNAIADLIYEPVNSRPSSERDWHIWFRKKNLERRICETAWGEKIQEIDLAQFVSPELISFLENGIRFKLIHTIFTTCIDPTLEAILEQICEENGKALKVYNFKGNSQLTSFRDDQDTERIVLVYLWGKMGDTEQSLGKEVIDYVFSEDDAMVTISDYIKLSNDNTLELFKNLFFNRRVMSIGCRFDDWKFRFFWYSIRGDLSRLSNGTVSFSCSDTDNDPLFQYLKNTTGLHVDNDSRGFMKLLSDVMVSETLFEKIKAKRVKSAKGVFLSYPSEDILTSSNIFHFFVDKCNFDVWMDTQALTVSDRYNSIIQSAIRDCGVFVPLLTSQVVYDITNHITDRYYMKEWKEAYNTGKTIIPITIGEYDYRKEYHNYFKEVCGFTGDNDITILPLTQIERIATKLKELLI